MGALHYERDVISDRATLLLQEWKDPLIDEHGIPAYDLYLEFFWLPRIGPTGIWAFRRLNMYLAAGETRVPLEQFAVELGVGHGVARNSPIVRTMARLVQFGFCQAVGGILQVRTKVSRLSAVQVARLPEHLQRAHANY